jgi:hypothetical protein
MTLIPPTIDVVQKLKKTTKSPTLTRVVDTFANDTIEATDKLQSAIDEIESILKNSDFDLKKRLDQNQETLKIWNLEKNFFLSRATKKVQAIQKNLRSSVEDVGRILMCQGKFESMEDFDVFVRGITKDLNSIEEKPIQDILDTYRRWLEDYKERLRV